MYNLQLFASTLKKCVEASQSLWPACEAVDVMYDVYGSSVPLAELLAAAGATSTLQHLATNFNERVSHYFIFKLASLHFNVNIFAKPMSKKIRLEISHTF